MRGVDDDFVRTSPQFMHDSQVQITDYDESDVPALADIHRAAFKGSMNAGMGRGYLRGMLRWFLHQPDTIAVRATINGEPCGYAVGMPLGHHGQLNRDLMLAAAVGVVTHPWILLQKRYRKSAAAKIKRVLGLDKPPPKQVPPEGPTPGANSGEYEGRCMAFVSMAVGRQFSGRGVGVALTHAIEERATKLGYDYVQLSVYTDNARAHAVYDKAGWDLCQQVGAVLLYKKKLARAASSS